MATPTGSLGQFGVGIENTAGVAVASQVLLDFFSETLHGKGRPIRSKAINNARSVRKAVMGGYSIDGDVNCEVTPDKFTKLIYATLTSYSSAGTAGAGTVTSTTTAVVGSGTAFLTDFAIGDPIQSGLQTRYVASIADDTHLATTTAFSPALSTASYSFAPFTHTFKLGTTLKSLTCHVRRPMASGAYFTYPGCLVSQFSLSAQLDAILQATCGFLSNGKEIISNPTLTNIYLASNAQSAERPFVFHNAAVQLMAADGSDLEANVDTNNWQINIATGAAAFKGFQGGLRQANRIIPGDSLVTGSFDFVFDSITQQRRWLGNLDGGSADTYGSTGITANNHLATLAMQLAFVQDDPEVVGTTRSLTIDIPKAYYIDSSPAITGRDGLITQALQFECLVDDDSNSDITVTVVNGEPPAAISDASTNIAVYS